MGIYANLRIECRRDAICTFGRESRGGIEQTKMARMRRMHDSTLKTAYHPIHQVC